MNIKDSFKRGTVEMLLLVLLSDEDMYGYQICQEVKKRSGDAIIIKEGSMYPILYKLVEGGYVSDEKKLSGKRMMRVYYHLLPKGLERLKELSGEYLLFSGGVQKIFHASLTFGSDGFD